MWLSRTLCRYCAQNPKDSGCTLSVPSFVRLINEAATVLVHHGARPGALTSAEHGKCASGSDAGLRVAVAPAPATRHIWAEEDGCQTAVGSNFAKDVFALLCDSLEGHISPA